MSHSCQASLVFHLCCLCMRILSNSGTTSCYVPSWRNKPYGHNICNSSGLVMDSVINWWGARLPCSPFSLVAEVSQCPHVSVAVTNTHSFRRKGFIGFIFPRHSPSLREVRAGTQAGAETGTAEEAIYWLAFHLCFLNTAQAHLPRLALITVGCPSHISHQSRKSPPLKHAHGSVWWMQFLHLRFLFPGCCSLCQVPQN